MNNLFFIFNSEWQCNKKIRRYLYELENNWCIIKLFHECIQHCLNIWMSCLLSKNTQSLFVINQKIFIIIIRQYYFWMIPDWGVGTSILWKELKVNNLRWCRWGSSFLGMCTLDPPLSSHWHQHQFFGSHFWGVWGSATVLNIFL